MNCGVRSETNKINIFSVFTMSLALYKHPIGSVAWMTLKDPFEDFFPHHCFSYVNSSFSYSYIDRSSTKKNIIKCTLYIALLPIPKYLRVADNEQIDSWSYFVILSTICKWDVLHRWKNNKLTVYSVAWDFHVVTSNSFLCQHLQMLLQKNFKWELNFISFFKSDKLEGTLIKNLNGINMASWR